ncbi:MAG: WD40/YVTN/BNR-like repeat-containing protein [Flavobacteriaceae bacterium]
MKNIISTALLILVGLFSFAQNTSYEIVQHFNLPGESIRAILPISETEMYFLSDQGTLGHVINTTEISLIQFDSLPYRAIASFEERNFGLSIGNPALIKDLSNSEVLYREDHPKVFYDAMAISKKGIGFAIGDPVQDVMSVLVSKDGGMQWKKVESKSLPRAIEGEAAFAASNSNLKILKNKLYFVSGGRVSRFYKSDDLGENWSAVQLPMISGKSTTGAYSMDFYDAETGIVLGGDYTDKTAHKDNIAITTNGGKTWKIVPENSSIGYRSCVQFAPEGNGELIFAIGTPGLSISQDGGWSWETYSELNNYYTLRFVNKNYAWIAGQEKLTLIEIH